MLIEKYTSQWVTYFDDLKFVLQDGLKGLDYQIEHIGSTAVPNLDAKPIIDIDIIYGDTPEFERIKTRLIKLGYYHNGNQGIAKREVFKINGHSSIGILDSIPHHLYVCLKHSEPLQRHLLMRDFLRKNEWARIKYQEMKYEIAKRANENKKLYAKLKEQDVNDFIDEIIQLEKSNVK